jgi:hypothetical protein
MLTRILLITILNKEVLAKPCITLENGGRGEEGFPKMPTEENLDDK